MRTRGARGGAAVWLVAALAACASPPAAPPGRAAAWGYVRLVPHEGLPAPSAGASSYGDRRLADVELVDYSRPGFAVVYAEDGAPPPAGAPVRLAVRSGPLGPRLEPGHAALGAGGAIEVANESGAARVVSCPAAGLVRRLAPGASLAIAVSAPGEWPVFLLDAPGEPARVFAAPGRWAVASEAGRFELSDLPPGRHRLVAWHPRFPPAATTVDLTPGRALRVDLDLQVGADGATAEADGAR